MICRISCLSPPPTPCRIFRCRFRTGWKSSVCPVIRKYEKYHIAKDFLVPKQIKQNGLERIKSSNFPKMPFLPSSSDYTRKPGSEIWNGKLRPSAGKSPVKWSKTKRIDAITSQFTQLRPEISWAAETSAIGQIEEKDQIGLVTGLAWTQVGGELLCVETLIMPGKGESDHHRQTGRCHERIRPGCRQLCPLPGRTV